jgi:hypothetical protein
MAPVQPFALQLWLWWSLFSTDDEWEDVVDARDVADPLEYPADILLCHKNFVVKAKAFFS